MIIRTSDFALLLQGGLVRVGGLFGRGTKKKLKAWDPQKTKPLPSPPMVTPRRLSALSPPQELARPVNAAKLHELKRQIEREGREDVPNNPTPPSFLALIAPPSS